MESHTIKPPTGDGIPCLCSNGPKLPNGAIKMHNHGEYRHLLPRYRHRLREPSGLVGSPPSRVVGGITYVEDRPAAAA